MLGKTVIITGASDGIGLAAARALKQKGANVVLVGRSAEKTKVAAKALQAPYYLADFSRLSEVRSLVKDLLRQYPRIDVLVNNAGGIFGKRALTEDGFEMTFQVNHLAHFLLSTLLIERLSASNATVINTSSVANSLFAKFDIDDLNMEKKYSANAAYGNAKLANILFTKELQKRYGGEGISVAAFHPGVVATSFATGSTSFLRTLYHSPFKRFSGLISPEKGADTLVWLATSKPGIDWQSGEYYVKRKIAKANKLAYNAEVASELWEQSMQMATRKWPPASQ